MRGTLREILTESQRQTHLSWSCSLFRSYGLLLSKVFFQTHTARHLLPLSLPPSFLQPSGHLLNPHDVGHLTGPPASWISLTMDFGDASSQLTEKLSAIGPTETSTKSQTIQRASGAPCRDAKRLFSPALARSDHYLTIRAVLAQSRCRTSANKGIERKICKLQEVWLR